MVSFITTCLTMSLGNCQYNNDHCASVVIKDTTVYSQTDSLRTTPILLHPVEKKFVPKHLVIFTPKLMINEKSEFQFLTDEHLSIQFDSDIRSTPSDNPSHYKYKLLFEENVQHRVTVTYPGYEDQFFEFISTQAPQYDTLSVIMYPVGTPLYYTKWDKRSFQPDSFSIVIIRNHYGSKEAFETLIKDLRLKRNNSSAMVFSKESGESFDQEGDPVLNRLRLQKDLVETAGHNFGSYGRITILTNQLRIVWKKKAEERTQEEQTQINSLLQKYQLKKIKEDLYEAPAGIGLYLNTIVAELNQAPIVRISYPETWQLIETHSVSPSK